MIYKWNLFPEIWLLLNQLLGEPFQNSKQKKRIKKKCEFPSSGRMSRIFPDTHQPSAFRLVLSSFCSSKKKKKKTFEDIIFHIGYDKDCGLQKAFKYTICEAPETPIGTIMAGLAGDKCGEVMDSCMENQRDPIHTNTQMTPGHST